MVRHATENDLFAVSEIYRRIHEEERRGKTATGWLPGVYPTKETARAALERGDLYVMEENAAVCAAAVINHIQVDVYADGNWSVPATDDEVLVLHTLAVEPSMFHRGFGRRFVRYYEELARQSGCRVLRMDTNAKNTAARRFYAKAGYTEVGTVPCVFNGIPDVPLVLLEKVLV